MKYQSGEEIRKGDKVQFHGEPGEIEFVAEELTGDPAIDWYIKEYGPGVSIIEPKFYGSAFIRDTENAEDLILVSRSLTTARLFLRSWEETDFELARSLWGDPDVMAFLGGALSDEKVRDKMHAEMACREKHGIQYWPVFEKGTEEFVGCCGLRPWAYSPPEGHELGFHLVKAKWNRGYASEIARAVVQHAFHDLRFSMLRAGHHPEHANSRKVLVQLGFEYVDSVFYRPTGLMHPTYKLKAPDLT